MKEFKSAKKQLELLENRGLIIENYKEAEFYLIDNNYYNVINMYGKYFQHPHQKDKYLEGARFNEIKAFHILDTELKTNLFNIKFISEIHSQLHISPQDPNQSPYHMFEILRLLLPKNVFYLLNTTIRKTIKNASAKIYTIDINIILEDYGFPKNWMNRPKLKQINK